MSLDNICGKWSYGTVVSVLTVTLTERLGLSVRICNQSQKQSDRWLAHWRLLSWHIYVVSHYLPTEKCSI